MRGRDRRDAGKPERAQSMSHSRTKGDFASAGRKGELTWSSPTPTCVPSYAHSHTRTQIVTDKIETALIKLSAEYVRGCGQQRFLRVLRLNYDFYLIKDTLSNCVKFLPRNSCLLISLQNFLETF